MGGVVVPEDVPEVAPEAAPRSNDAPESAGVAAAGFDHDRICFDPATPDDRPPVRIFIGTEDGQWRAERVLLWSIALVRDPSRAYEVHLMKNLSGFRDGRWLTGFTNYRFLIPHLTGGRGRAIYNDVDQIYLRDPALLFDQDMHGAGYLTINERDTSVMLMDTEKMIGVWPLGRVRTNRRKLLDRRAARTPGLWGRLDGGWNARDTEYEPGRSGCVHFTTIHTQPWMPAPKRFIYQHNPIGELWFDLERSAEAAAFHAFSEERPSLQYRQLLARLRAAPPGAVPADAPELAEDRERMLIAADAASVLAYGVGAGEPGAIADLQLGDRRIAQFDPASRPLDKKPAEKFDAVVFTHGMEAVPDPDLPWLIESLFQLARRALHVSLRDDATNARASRPGWARGRFAWSELFAAAAVRHPEVEWRIVATGEGSDSASRKVTWARGRGWSAGAPPRVWVLCDDAAQHATESTALADELGWPYELRAIAPSSLDRLRSRMPAPNASGVARPGSDALAPPWPDLVISAGPDGAAASRWIADESAGHTRIVHIGRDACRVVDALDLEVTCTYARQLPHRRRLETTVPMNGVTEAALSEARERWPELRAAERSSPVVLLADGTSAQYDLDSETARRLGREVAELAGGRAVLAVTHPETPAAVKSALAEGLGGEARLLDRDPTAGSEYFGCLAHAGSIVVTGDSAAMPGDAVATGAPVYIYPIAEKPHPLRWRFVEWARAQAHARPLKRGKGSVRPQAGWERLWSRALELGLVRPNADLTQLSARLVERGIAEWFGASLAVDRREPLHETDTVAGAVREIMSLPAGPQTEALRAGARDA